MAQDAHGHLGWRTSGASSEAPRSPRAEVAGIITPTRRARDRTRALRSTPFGNDTLISNIESYAPLPAALRAEGLDPDRILRELGLDPSAPAQASAARAPEVVLRLLERGVANCGDGFAVRAAARLRIDALGVLGFVCLTAPDLGAALERSLRYRRVLFASDAYALEAGRDPCRLVRRAVPEAPQFPVGARALVELGLAEYLGALREITGEALTPLEVRFAHAAPADVSALAGFFRAPLVFGAERHELVFPQAWLALPSRHGHPGLASFFEAQAHALLEATPTVPDLAGRVRSLLVAGLRGQTPTARALARQLAMSERTLSRRLTAEGTSLLRLLDEVRHELALRYLASDRLSVGEVAFLLGFSEPSAFHRAFKRWTGRTPAKIRRAHELSGERERGDGGGRERRR